PPDLIVSDVMMPQMSGDQMVREVRAHPELDAVPILLLTAKADEELRVQMLRAGAQDYLTKPFSAEELRARAGNLVTMKRARDRALSPAAGDPGADAPIVRAAAGSHRFAAGVCAHRERAAQRGEGAVRPGRARAGRAGGAAAPDGAEATGRPLRARTGAAAAG